MISRSKRNIVKLHLQTDAYTGIKNKKTFEIILHICLVNKILFHAVILYLLHLLETKGKQKGIKCT
jgi:hypothetical protein